MSISNDVPVVKTYILNCMTSHLCMTDMHTQNDICMHSRVHYDEEFVPHIHNREVPDVRIGRSLLIVPLRSQSM